MSSQPGMKVSVTNVIRLIYYLTVGAKTEENTDSFREFLGNQELSQCKAQSPEEMYTTVSWVIFFFVKVKA